MFLALVLLSLITYSFANQIERNGVVGGCKMAYMSPSYIKLEGFGLEYSRLAGKYSTYLYRETGWDNANEVRLSF